MGGCELGSDGKRLNYSTIVNLEESEQSESEKGQKGEGAYLLAAVSRAHEAGGRRRILVVHHVKHFAQIKALWRRSRGRREQDKLGTDCRPALLTILKIH